MRDLRTVFQLLILCLSLSGFPRFGHAAPEIAPKQASKVRVGVSPATSTAGVFFAQELGYFKAENIDAEIQVFPTSTAPMIPLLAKGELDVGGGVIAAALFKTANLNDAEIRIVADKGSARKDFDYIKLMIRKDLIQSGRYKSYSDLKGLQVGVTAFGGTSTEATFALFLKKGGLVPKDVTFVKAGYSDANKAFASKSIDAFVQIEPYVSEAVEKGIAAIAGSAYEIHPNQQSAAIFYSPEFIKKRRPESVKFMRAYIRGIRSYLQAFGPKREAKNYEEGVRILSKWTSVKDPQVFKKMIPAGLDPDGKLNLDSINADLDYYVTQGYLPEKPNITQFADLSIVEEALLGLKKQ